MASIKRDEALQIARAFGAAACCLNGQSEKYCQFMREGAYDADPAVQSALAALTISDVHLEARLKEIRERSVNVLELAA